MILRRICVFIVTRSFERNTRNKKSGVFSVVVVSFMCAKLPFNNINISSIGSAEYVQNLG